MGDSRGADATADPRLRATAVIPVIRGARPGLFR